MKKALKIIFVFAILFMAKVTFATATEECPSGWKQNTDAYSGNKRSDCCPVEGTFTYGAAKGACMMKYDETICKKYGGSKEWVSSSYYCVVQTRAMITVSTSTSKNFTLTFTRNDSTKNPATFTSGSQIGGVVQSSCSTGASSTSCKINNPPSITRKHYTLKGWSKDNCSSLLRFPATLTYSYIAKACWNEVAACYLCGNSQSGGYYYGKFAEARECNYFSAESKTACEAHNTKEPTQDPDDFVVPTGNSGESTTTWSQATYYKITYNLDGGKYIDGSTSRTQIVRGDLPVGDPITNPVKEGQSFVEWQYNGTKFDFSKTLDEVAPSVTADSNGFKNVEFTAIYTEYGDADLVYCEDKNAVLDLSTQKCYTTLKENASANTYTHTTYTWNDGRYCESNGVVTLDVNSDSTEGKANAEDGVYAGWSKEAWLSQNSCLALSSCSNPNSSISGSCTMRWDAILYKAVDAKEKEREYAEDDGSGDSEDDGTSDKTDEEGKQLQTGDALIYTVIALGLGGLGYSTYYFIKKKKEETV